MALEDEGPQQEQQTSGEVEEVVASDPLYRGSEGV